MSPITPKVLTLILGSKKTKMEENQRFQLLNKADLNPDPFLQFKLWFDLAHEKIKLYPEHMVLSTVDADMYPQSRIVLLRGLKPPYFQFYTNYQSDKAVQAQSHVKASILFYWKELGKQIRVIGNIEKCSDLESDQYWSTRPRESQIHAWASAQSAAIDSYEDLKKNVADIESKFRKDLTIPRPPHWGGLQLNAQKFEFWQEGEFRLHHRFVYKKTSSDTWSITRLNP